jgi:hypothetical protein
MKVALPVEERKMTGKVATVERQSILIKPVESAGLPCR